MNGIIYVFGPSCSGKSTLGKALKERLGNQWTYLDRDRLIKKGLCTESTADKALEAKIQEVGNRIIIDAQVPWTEKKEREIYCLLLPPLETLLQRDARRTERLNRSELRARYAREYVEETHDILNGMDKERFDICLDSSLLPVQEIVSKVLGLLECISYS